MSGSVLPIRPGVGNQMPPGNPIGPGTPLFTVSASPFLNAGVITFGGTVSAATLAASSLIGNATKAGAVPTAIGLSGGGIAFSGSNLIVEWNAGTIAHLSTGLSISSDTLTAQWQGGLVTAFAGGISLAANVLTGPGGTVTKVTVDAAPFLANTTITGAGTVSAAAITKSSLLGNSSTVTAVPGVIGIGLSLAFSGSTLLVQPITGTTAARPLTPVLGEEYFDTNLGFPVWWSGTNWVNATGVPS